jgi:hypothetical protein
MHDSLHRHNMFTFTDLSSCLEIKQPQNFKPPSPVQGISGIFKPNAQVQHWCNISSAVTQHYVLVLLSLVMPPFVWICLWLHSFLFHTGTRHECTSMYTLTWDFDKRNNNNDWMINTVTGAWYNGLQAHNAQIYCPAAAKNLLGGILQRKCTMYMPLACGVRHKSNARNAR